MSRPALPADPSYTTRDFAPDANYPAGANPWNGQPTKVEPPGAASSGFVPDTGAGAQFFNKLMNDAFAQDAAGKTYDQALAAYQKTVLDAVAQSPAMNFRDARDAAGSRVIKYVPQLRLWIEVGDLIGFGAATYRTSNDPTVGGTATEIPALQQNGTGTLTGWDFDTKYDGAAIVTYQYKDGSVFRDEYAERTPAGTWTKRTGSIGFGYYYATVAVDGSGNWVIAGKSEGGKSCASRSTDRVTWLPATDASIASIPDGANMAVNCDGSSTFVIVGFLGTNVYFTKSTDGGATWSTADVHALGFTANPGSEGRFPKAQWNGAYWLATVSDVPNRKTKVFKSTDGATWTEVASYTSNFGLAHIACSFLPAVFGGPASAELWVGYDVEASSDNVVFSVNAGTTWHRTDRNFTNTMGGRLKGLGSNGSRFVLLGTAGGGSDGKAYVGHANGLGVQIV